MLVRYETGVVRVAMLVVVLLVAKDQLFARPLVAAFGNWELMFPAPVGLIATPAFGTVMLGVPPMAPLPVRAPAG